MAYLIFSQHFVRRREIFDCITVSCKRAQNARRKLPSRVAWLFVRWKLVFHCRCSSCRYQSAQVFDQKGELQGISGKRLEAVFLIEAPGRLVFGVDDNGTQAGDVGGVFPIRALGTFCRQPSGPEPSRALGAWPNPSSCVPELRRVRPNHRRGCNSRPLRRSWRALNRFWRSVPAGFAMRNG